MAKSCTIQATSLGCINEKCEVENPLRNKV